MTSLLMWTIYCRPLDYPDKYVARLWQVSQRGARASVKVLVADSLTEIRELLPPGLTCLKRYTDDDPCIVETWV